MKTTKPTTDMNPITIDLSPLRTLAGLRGLQREMNRFFDTSPAANRVARYPLLNLSSDKDGALVTAELPGVDPQELEITLDKAQLTLRGKVKDGAPEGEGVVCHRKERPAGEFVRTIALPFEVEEGKVLAKYDKGVLAITLPRAEKTKPKTIPVIAG